LTINYSPLLLRSVRWNPFESMNSRKTFARSCPSCWISDDVYEGSLLPSPLENEGGETSGSIGPDQSSEGWDGEKRGMQTSLVSSSCLAPPASGLENNTKKLNTVQSSWLAVNSSLPASASLCVRCPFDYSHRTRSGYAPIPAHHDSPGPFMKRLWPRSLSPLFRVFFQANE
jgi:hypothetical protein